MAPLEGDTLMNNTSEIFHIFESSDSQNFMPSQGFSGVEGEPVAVQMSAPPEFAWTRLLGTSEDDVATALTTAGDGSIYVAGYTNGDLGGQTNSGGRDAFITKYQPDGTQDWTRLLGTSGWDGASALTTGSDGSIYVAGTTEGDLNGQTNSGLSDAFISRFQPDGTQDWTRLLGTSGWDQASALTTGSDGSIYVAGYTYGDLDGQTNSGVADAFISRFQPDGTQDWTRLLGTSNFDQASALTTGSDGSIYVAGTTEGDLDEQTLTGFSDAFVSRFQPDGTQDWTRLLGSDVENAYALTTGSDGSIYVAGSTTGNLDGQTNSSSFYAYAEFDAFISRFQPDGTQDWTRLLGSGEYEGASALTTGSDGSIYVAGSTTGNLDGQINSGMADGFISRFQPDGTKDWTRLLGTSDGDSANAMTTGSDGSIYVAGETRGDLDGQTNSGGGDAFISRLIVDGTDTPERPEIHQVINWDSFPPQITGVLPTENQGSITQPLPNQWFGTDHHDVIIGTASDETLLGFQGDDWLQVSQGNNTLFGGQGNDILVAGQGDDILLGNKDDDILFGGDGNDAIYGGQGNDTLVAGNGNQILFGDQGNDILFGGTQGVDTLVGGEGNDTLVMLPGEGYSIVTDFQVNQDMVVLLGSPDDYEIGSLPSGFHSGTAIYVAGSDQLVGVLEGVTNVSLEDGNIFGWG